MLRENFRMELNRRLDLTPGQSARIDTTMREGQERMREIWSLVRPEIQAEMRAVREEIRRELTPEQRRKFEQMIRERRPRPAQVEPPFRDRPPRREPPADTGR